MRGSFSLLPILCLSLMACSESSNIKKNPAIMEGKYFSAQEKNENNSIDLAKVGPQLTETMLKCPDKIWPNYNWKDKGVLLSMENSAAYYWDGATGKTTLVPPQEIPEDAQGGTYNEITYKGKQAVSFYLTEEQKKYYPQNQILPLIVHEGFHFWGQAAWTRAADKGGSRGTAYPALAAPRIYRQMLMKNLMDYTYSDGKDEKALQKAAYWNELWKKEFPQEFNNTTDGYEGTAEYVSAMTSIIAESGCDATDEELIKNSQNAFEDLQEHMTLGNSADGEGYPIGASASLILKLYKKDSDWFQKMTVGETPTDVLLKNIVPLAEMAPAKFIESIEERVRLSNASAAEWLEPDLKKLPLTEFIRFAIPVSALQGSYGVKAFLTPTAFPGVDTTVLSGALTFKAASWSATLPDKAILFRLPQNPCQGTFGTVLVHKDDLQFSDSYSVQFKGAGPQGNIRGKLQIDNNGFSWFCGE